MSALAGVLAGDHLAGVYRWRSGVDVADVRHTVEHAGWRFGHVDGVRVETVAELHTALDDALVLPPYYGRNLDALAECLADCDGAQVLLWDSWGVFARAEPRVFGVVLGLMVSSEITTLLRGPGPDVDVPLLD